MMGMDEFREGSDMAGPVMDYPGMALTVAEIHHDLKIKTLVEVGVLEVDDDCRIIPSPGILEQVKQENSKDSATHQLKIARARTFLHAVEAYFRQQHEEWKAQ